MNRVTINDVGKVVAVLIVLVGGIAIAVVGLIIRENAGVTAGVGLTTLALGYVFGNGRLAARTEAPATMLTPVLDEHRYVAKDDLEQLAELNSARKRVSDRVDKAKARS